MMESFADIEIILLVMVWSALNHSLIRDWIARRDEKSGGKR